MQKLSASLYEMLRNKRERETLSLALLPKVLEFKACAATSLLNSWLTSLNCAALGTLRSLLYKMASLYVRDARKLAIASLAQRDVMSLTSRLGEYLTGLINRGFGLHQAEALIGGQHR